MNDTTGIALPPLGDEAVTRIERAVFDEIADDAPRATTSVPHRRKWPIVLAVAAAFVIGVVVSPPLLSSIVQVGTSASESAPDSVGGSDAGAYTADKPVTEADRSAGGQVDTAVPPVPGADETAQRDIITTAVVVLQVSDVQDAADAVGRLAEEHDGYVESASVGSSDSVETTVPAPEAPESGTGRVAIRIPAESLEEVLGALGDHGEVLRSSVSREDVTSVAVDLRARVDAARASVARLTELMSKSGSLSDLIAAETALNERQAQLEAYEQELKRLDEQVAMSTVTVELAERAATAKADPAGFTDGLLAGWNGLIAALNAVVVALGFVLPWLVPVALVLLVWWLVRRRADRRRTSAAADR
ncbi:DUF4349 domain-containing protein [Microbacterium sp.]|uniref:DUF4349 domain-containing protein n=1 Tax=Microbacterium sp. TaxID=51671 RepID=UPI00281195A2|nr:DUF4349 domain-containing protein [Microbacterium sp.]